MKALIFGANGQDGKYLSDLLLTQGVDVVGISRSNTDVIGDIVDTEFVGQIIKAHKPNFLFHLAANSTTSHEALFENHETIGLGTINVLEGVKKYSPETKVFLSGSALQFKNIGEPIDENTDFDGNSPYSVARIYSVYAGRYYREKFHLNVYVGYFFNHDSPLRTERHVNQKIVAAVKRIAAGSDEKLVLGNIDVKKEFNFAGDIVRAVWMLVNQDRISEAVIGCGKPYSIQNWVEFCFGSIGKNWKDYVEVRDDYVPEYSTLVSNPSLLKGLGWEPIVGIEKLASLMLENK
ncbi:MAG: GDP-mannose 4,6-dehydratase [Imperialibacter sp.]|uniref:GDP-mannose 4,6-dehydratase n=1 Tax=Imperialibacter sp. TaxID=2038411 RepID=UPI0032EAD8CC